MADEMGLGKTVHWPSVGLKTKLTDFYSYNVSL
jgi:hypothetical protein